MAKRFLQEANRTMAKMVNGGLKKLLVIFITVFLTIPACARGSESNPILIGATLSLEGKYSEPSFMIQNAFRLWEKEVNLRGGLLGRPVKLILYDDKSQKKLVRQLYKKLIMEDKVDLVFSPYPEFLLLDLPEDSPLRGPILTIESSGKKAAAIVQDLLTLARRGVAVTKVTNLNDVISEYLGSLEFEKLKKFHPNTKIDVNLNKDLFNITGSPVHLSKTVMNLVSNAAEASPDGGHISISTKNQYVDQKIRGYDEVMEGDYVVLTVADDGIGISAEDKEKIFEPFYSKKVMGRSGTGLGMAVVWGSVKDHRGYIDVVSEVGKGTEFKLYFPVTRKKTEKNDSDTSIEEYLGDGEKILVIDDVREQRDIASMLLTKLGYSVTAVSSG